MTWAWILICRRYTDTSLETDLDWIVDMEQETCLTACEKPRNAKKGSFVVLDEDDPEKAAEVQRKLHELDGELARRGRKPHVGEEIGIAPDLAHWKAPPLEHVMIELPTRNLGSHPSEWKGSRARRPIDEVEDSAAQQLTV